VKYTTKINPFSSRSLNPPPHKAQSHCTDTAVTGCWVSAEALVWTSPHHIRW